MTTGILTETFAYGHAAAASWRQAAEACLAQCGSGVRTATLGFVYATDALADSFGEIVDFLRRRTGIAHWVGTVGLGICASGSEYLDEPALAIMCCSFDDSAFRVLPLLQSPREVAQARMEWGNHAASFAVLHADPSSSSLLSLLRELAARTESGFVVGGLTSSRGRSVQYADGAVEGGLSGVLFSEEVVIATRLTQGCSPIGPRHRVSAARHNVLIELDGRPALEVLREDIGPETSGSSLSAIGGLIFAGLPIEGSDTGDYVVRNLVGIDSSHQLVAIGEAVSPGGEVDVLPARPRHRQRRPGAHADQHPDRPVSAPARRTLLLLPGPRRGPVRRRFPGAAHDPRRPRGRALGGFLLQRRDLPQPAVRLHRRAHVVPLWS